LAPLLGADAAQTSSSRHDASLRIEAGDWARLGANRVLARLRRRVDLLLRHVQHVLGLLADRANHVGRAASNADGPALRVFTDLVAPVPDGEPSDDRSENESKHRRPPFVGRLITERRPGFRGAREVPRSTFVDGWK